jgi:hypothetical protein
MKSLFLIFVVSVLCVHASAQESTEKIMEGRAREMMRVIGLDDKEQWKKFITENFTQAFINRPMRTKITSPDNKDGAPAPEAKPVDKLENKTSMFGRLHNDFGGGKITSLKTIAEKVEMVVVNDSGLKGTFTLNFDKTKPYLIDGLKIDAGN